MIFTQPVFAAFFIVVFCGAWLLSDDRRRKLWLLLTSYVFYAAWDWRFLALIWISTAVDFVAGAAVARADRAATRRRWVWLSVIANLGLLAAFKYFGFFVDSAVALLESLGVPAARPDLAIVLPVGISFYTFQSLSYTLDIHRGRLEPVRSALDFGLFVAFFPQLVAGPIVRARTFLPQLLTRPRWAKVDVRGALALFLRGFVKKACIADTVAPLVDGVFSNPGAQSAEAIWLGVSLFAVQIYCDFSGYTDMAIGSARLLGYELTPNFHFPFLARNIEDFWRRWHISLSTWFRDYVYIPLRAQAQSEHRALLSVFVTMTLVGLWHGAAWTFVAWGAAHGAAMALHRVFARMRGPLRRPTRLGTALSVAGTLWFFLASLILFRAESFADAWVLLRGFLTFQAAGTGVLDPRLMLLVAGLGVCHWLGARGWPGRWIDTLPTAGFAAAYGAAAALALAFVPMRSEPFIYFQF